MARFSLLLAAAASFVAANVIPQVPLAEHGNATIMGGSGFDQIRFLQCVKDDFNNFGRMIAYYSHPPQGSEKPTQVAFKQHDSVQWGDGCKIGGRATDGAGWGCDIDKYVWSEDKFKAYVGTITYGWTGFNCFIDDGHGAHLEGGEYGMCYTELYCTYEHAQTVAIGASKETVNVERSAWGIDGKIPPGLTTMSPREYVNFILSKPKENAGNQICSPSMIDLTPACQMSTSCSGGQREYIDKLLRALITVYDTDQGLYALLLESSLHYTDKTSFKGIDEKECGPQQPICDPATGRCKERPDMCKYTKGAEMPRKYALSIVDKAPPLSGQSSPELGHLDVEIICEYHKNDVMCAAMGTLLSGLSLFGPLAGIFGAAGLGVSGGCGA
jgi:hypothetical protein